MGQQHSGLPGKGVAITNLVTSTAENADTSTNHLFPTNQNAAGQDHAPSSNPPPPLSSGSGSSSAASGFVNGVEQAQSVRAAIDSFIETCLAGSDEGPPPPSSSPKPPHPGRHTPGSIEVITVPDEDDSDGDNAQKGEGSNPGGGGGGGGKDRNGVKGQQKKKKDSAAQDTVTNSAPEKKTDSVTGNDLGPSLGDKAGKDLPPPQQSLSVVSVPKTDPAASSGSETGSVPSSKPSQNANAPAEKAGNSSSSSSRDDNPSSHITEAPRSALEGIESMRLKTIIDRMLDNSLGGGSDLNSGGSAEQRILPQIIAEERSEASGSGQGDKSRNGGDTSGTAAGGSERRGDPMAICFMEHIEKAVERSFSSITEEEERKEKEKSLGAPSAGKASSEGKNSAWSGRTSKPSDAAAAAAPPVSGGDGTISVQDIVDRVISQTEGVAKHPLPSQQADLKPTVSASGTFYPDKAPVDSNNHPSQPQRRETHKDDTPRETVGRRGRPRMRSPCPERRESVPAPEYLHGPREAPRRGPAVLPGEDYLQSMQVALAKYGTVHPTHHMPPFLQGAVPVSGALTKGGVAVSAAVAQNSFRMGGLHASPGSLQSRLHGAQHAALSSHPPPPHHQHASLASQPPPLLRVDGMGERGEHPHLGQPKAPPPAHPPSRSCMCSACLMYWARERDAERVRMVQHQQQQQHQHQQQQQQQQQQQHHHQQPSPVERGGLSRMPPHPSHPSHPAYSKPVPAPSHSHSHSHSHKWPLEARHLDAAKQDKPHPHYPYPRGQDPYPASHPAYGIQTGVPVPHVAYADKQSLDARHTDTHYPKPYEMEYPHRQAKPDSGGREMGPGRHAYPTSISSSKPPCVPSHPQQPLLAPPHPSVHAMSGAKPDVPLLDLTYKKDSTLSVGEEEKPLDLSAKKPSSPMYYERQEMRHRREGEHRYDGGEGVEHNIHGGMLSERGREGEKYMSASQHLHNLETSVETHFQKLQHAGHRGGMPLHAMPISAAYSGGMPPHRTSPVVPPQTGGRPPPNSGHGSSVPLPPHHPTLPPSHAGSSVGGGAAHPGYVPALQPHPGYPPEPLLSPGGRRPQLHPIPPPNPSTTLGSAPPRSAPAFQSRGGGASSFGGGGGPSAPAGSSLPGVSAGMSAMPGASTSPMVSLPSTLPRATPPALPVAESSPQRSGSGGHPQFPSDYPPPRGSRSVSPLSESRGEDGQRGNGVSKHEPIHSLLGNNNPQDILYLICRLCRQTYGSPYGFRKHFRNQHGFEPKAEHALVQTISATKNARQMSGGATPTLDPESPSQDSHGRPSRTSSIEGVACPSHSSSPRPDMVRSMVTASPGNTSGESVGDAHSVEGVSGGGEHRLRNSFSRSSTDSKGRPPSGGSVGEEREDTKCLECPECGQTFQLNDFGSYKRHCRQHSQMKGVVGREGGASQGVYSCADCQCSYPEPQMLQDHVQRHHANIAPLACPLCRASLPSSAEYQDHMRTVHNSSFHEAAPSSSSSSPPITVSDRAKVSSATSSHCDISSSSTSSVKRETPTTSLTNAATTFNLTVTTPSDLEICRLPADPIVTSASPDSSSDNKKAQDADSKKGPDSSPVSSSEMGKPEGVKTESSVDSPKSGSSEGTDSARTSATDNKDGTKTDMDGSKQFPSASDTKCHLASVGGSSNSSLDADENADLFMYKHKKFSAHRKRSASNVSESSVSEAKQACLDVNSTKTEKTQQNVVSSATEKVQSKTVDSKSKGLGGGEEGKGKTTTTPSKTEARHSLPFVWDRVTRSQAGKHARSSDYS